MDPRIPDDLFTADPLSFPVDQPTGELLDGICRIAIALPESAPFLFVVSGEIRRMGYLRQAVRAKPALPASAAKRSRRKPHDPHRSQSHDNC